MLGADPAQPSEAHGQKRPDGLANDGYCLMFPFFVYEHCCGPSYDDENFAARAFGF